MGAGPQLPVICAHGLTPFWGDSSKRYFMANRTMLAILLSIHNFPTVPKDVLQFQNGNMHVQG